MTKPTLRVYLKDGTEPIFETNHEEFTIVIDDGSGNTEHISRIPLRPDAASTGYCLIRLWKGVR
jgi:hypothetical protein